MWDEFASLWMFSSHKMPARRPRLDSGHLDGEMDRTCGTESPLYRCFRDTRVMAASVRRRPAMAIGSALERGSLICVYDEHGSTLFQKSRGSGATDGLIGCTGSTVTVRFGSVIYTYDEKGMTIYAKAA